MKALKLIIAREFLSRVKTKAFIWTTLLTPFLMLAVVLLPSIIMNLKSSDIHTVYVMDKTGMYGSLFKDKGDFSFQSLDVDSERKNWGGTTALLEINADLTKKPDAVTFYSEMQKPPAELTDYIRLVLAEAVRNTQIEEYTTQKEIEPVIANKLQEIATSPTNVRINTYRWDETGEAQDTIGALGSSIGLMFTFIMFFFVMMYGSLVMQSVVEEKTNRIVEVIVSSVKPFYLMMGKIIGIALTGLAQIIVWTLIIGIAIAAFYMLGDTNISTENMQQAMDIAGQNKLFAGVLEDQFSALSAINWIQVIFCFVAYFIGGYLLYAALFAMFGSAANDSQEAQQFVTPLTVILMVAFYVGFAAGVKNPEGSVAIWGSIVPFTSPIVMMARSPFEIPIWQIIVSLLLLYTTAILMTFLAAKIYRTGILMYGKKVSFAEIFRWLKYK